MENFLLMPVEKISLAVLISGRGSNLQAILKSCEDSEYPAKVSVVISNKPQAPGLESAQKAGILSVVVDHTQFQTRAHFEDALHTELLKHPVDLIVLAGFLRILTADFVNKWTGRIINVHPSLLPDYKGLDTHARAIADGKKEAGCTIHFVVPEMDAGPIILQRKVPILTEDTPESLAERVLEQEHYAYPEAIRMVANKLSKSRK